MPLYSFGGGGGPSFYTDSSSFTSSITATMDGNSVNYTGSNQTFTITEEGYLINLGKSQQLNNTAFGDGVLSAITNGIKNTGFGYHACEDITTAGRNTGFGHSALANNITGDDNVMIGANAGNGVTSDRNVGVGSSSLLVETGSRNTALGYFSFEGHTTGNDNVSLGNKAGSVLISLADNTDSAQSIYIGSATKANSAGSTNETVFGYGAEGKGDNASVWNNTSTTNNYFSGALAIEDGVTAPSALVGYAKFYVDVADGDLKIIFGDGTIKTIVTD